MVSSALSKVMLFENARFKTLRQRRDLLVFGQCKAHPIPVSCHQLRIDKA
jgi:hypothetical protein